jgi:hypothetical protein
VPSVHQIGDGGAPWVLIVRQSDERGVEDDACAIASGTDQGGEGDDDAFRSIEQKPIHRLAGAPSRDALSTDDGALLSQLQL